MSYLDAMTSSLATAQTMSDMERQRLGNQGGFSQFQGAVKQKDPEPIIIQQPAAETPSIPAITYNINQSYSQPASQTPSFNVSSPAPIQTPVPASEPAPAAAPAPAPPAQAEPPKQEYHGNLGEYGFSGNVMHNQIQQMNQGSAWMNSWMK
jgi:hypothetical protein